MRKLYYPKNRFLIYTIFLGVFFSLQAFSKPFFTFYELLKVPENYNLNNFKETDFKNLESVLLKIPINSKEQIEKNVWYKINLEREPYPETQVHFQIKAAHIKYAEAILVENGKIIAKAHAGFSIPIENRRFFSVDLFLPLQEWTTNSATIFLKVIPTAPQPLIPEINSTTEITRFIAFDVLIITFYISALLILGIYQSFVFYNIRDKASAYYVCFILTMFLSGISRSGYIDLIFSNTHSAFYMTEYNIFFIASVFFSAFQFTRAYFNMSEVTPKFDKFFKYSMMSVLVLYLFVSAYSASLLWKLVPTVNLISSFVVIGYSIRAVRKKQIGSKYFLFAWGGFLIGITVFNLANIGLIPMPNYLRYLTYYAGIYEVVTMSLGLAHRLSRFKDLEQKEKMQNVENQSLHKLVRILCHDVANPLSVITISTDMTKQFINSQQIEKALNRIDKIKSSTVFINRIIEEVRLLEAVDSGKLKIPLTNVCLEDAIFESCSVFEDKSIEKNIQFNFNFSKQNKTYVISDLNTLQTNVIANILSNAIKFSYPNSQIHFSIESNLTWTLLKIKDSGIGIPKELIEKIFIPGAATSRKGTKNENGTGFGMLLIKSFMESYEGDIQIESIVKTETSNDHNEYGTTIILKFKTAKTESHPTPNTTKAA